MDLCVQSSSCLVDICCIWIELHSTQALCERDHRAVGQRGNRARYLAEWNAWSIQNPVVNSEQENWIETWHHLRNGLEFCRGDSSRYFHEKYPVVTIINISEQKNTNSPKNYQMCDMIIMKERHSLVCSPNEDMERGRCPTSNSLIGLVLQNPNLQQH
jgi:hypothetical protein